MSEGWRPCAHAVLSLSAYPCCLHLIDLSLVAHLHLRLPVIDLTELTAEEQGLEVSRLLKAEARQPFNLTQGPLLRATLIHTTPTSHVLALSLHHTICDGWSLGILVRELSTLYNAALTNAPTPLPDLPLQPQRRWDEWLSSGDV